MEKVLTCGQGNLVVQNLMVYIKILLFDLRCRNISKSFYLDLGTGQWETVWPDWENVWVTFKSQWQQCISPKWPHFCPDYEKVSKSFVFPVKAQIFMVIGWLLLKPSDHPDERGSKCIFVLISHVPFGFESVIFD